MGLFEKIAPEEIEMIKNQVRDFAKTGGNRVYDMDDWNAEYILREWENAKSIYLSKMFGEELILRKPIEYVKGTDEISAELDDGVYPDCFWKLCRIFDDIQSANDTFAWSHEESLVRVMPFYRDIGNDAAYTMRQTIYNLCSIPTLAENTYTGRTIEIPLPPLGEKKLKVNTGCRALKMLARLLEAFGLDMEEFERFRIYHSQVLNQKRLKGTLCLSIHPLDYITMSDNDCGWESCMSWENEGCYRQGTVEMMNSRMVIVAYLEADHPYQIAKNSWNNKKWRELYIVHPDIITNVKGYPYCNEALTKEVLMWLRDLAHKSAIWDDGADHYTDKIYHHQMDDTDKDELLKERKTEFHFRTGIMYNDFGHWFHYCVIDKDLPYDSNPYINYSGQSECVICGELDPDFASTADGTNLACEGCDDVFRCDCCGEIIEGDEYTCVGDEHICSYCIENSYVYDAFNQEYVHQDHTMTIYIANEDLTGIAEDYDLQLIVHEGTDPADLCETGEFIRVKKKTLWGNYYYYKCIKQGTWTDEFLRALSYNLYNARNEAAVYRALKDSQWIKVSPVQ